MPNTRRGWFFFGLFFMGIGLSIYSKKGWTIFRGAPQHHTLGYVFMAGGIIFCLFSILKKDFPKNQLTHVICISCLKPSNKRELIEDKCPKCNGEVDDLIGFFDRHPELKNKD